LNAQKEILPPSPSLPPPTSCIGKYVIETNGFQDFLHIYISKELEKSRKKLLLFTEERDFVCEKKNAPDLSTQHSHTKVQQAATFLFSSFLIY
jgi:hypothetical protein